MKIRMHHTIEREYQNEDKNGNTYEYQVEVTVEADYYYGEPERGPTYSCGGTPAEPDSVDIISAFEGDVETVLTNEEEDMVREYLLENPPCAIDYDDRY